MQMPLERAQDMVYVISEVYWKFQSHATLQEVEVLRRSGRNPLAESYFRPLN